MAPSQSCESMHSIQSMSSIRLGQWAASGGMATCSAQSGCHDDRPASDRDDVIKIPDVVEEKLVSDDPLKTVSYEDGAVPNGDAACRYNAICEEVQEGGGDKSSHELVDIQGETLQPTLVDLSPVGEVRPTVSCEESRVDVIVGDTLVDLSPETGLESSHLETNGGRDGELVDLSPVGDSLEPVSCTQTDTMRDGGIPAHFTPLLLPTCASTPNDLVAPSNDCVNGLTDDLNCDTEQKLVGNGSLVHENKMVDHTDQPVDDISGNTERTPCAAAMIETNGEQVAPSTGDGRIEACSESDRCNDADSIAQECDKKNVKLATRIEATSDDNVDAVG